MLLALGIDACLGWPDRLYRIAGHPVTWIGRGVDALDRGLNRSAWSTRGRRLAGVVAALLVIGGTGALASALAALLPGGVVGIALTGILAWPLVAARALHDHVAAVARPLVQGEIAAARDAVSLIVGRDPARLDEAGITRAALESLAENASDGVVAPLFWGCLFGLPGIAAYKAINTLDSMIGHRTPQYRDFGWASARIDDAANFVPARLTALLLAAVCLRPRTAVAVVRRDARRHRSPNAGWPEAAMAGALGIRLSGPRVYADHVSNEPWVNGVAPDPSADDLFRALALYRRAMLLLGASMAVLAVL